MLQHYNSAVISLQEQHPASLIRVILDNTQGVSARVLEGFACCKPTVYILCLKDTTLLFWPLGPTIVIKNKPTAPFAEEEFKYWIRNYVR